MDPAAERRLAGLRHLIGNTPLLAVTCEFRGQRRVVHAKAEHLNMSGSIKDRMALHVLRRAAETGALTTGQAIAEATSGNTGISISLVGRALGHPVTIFMPDWMSRERIDLIRSLGAEVRLVSREDGGFLGAIREADAFAERTGAFLPHQFSNEHNVDAHASSTGPEIWFQLRAAGLVPDAFVAGVGTGGTVMGVGRYLRSMRPEVRIHPLEPSNSPTLSTGYKVGRHRIQGISDDFVPPIVDLSQLDPVLGVDDGDAIRMAQALARTLGLGVGISSGANFLGALAVSDGWPADAVVVTVFPDDNKKYLSTDLLRDEPVREGFLSSDVELLGFASTRRVCRTCLAPEGQVVPLRSA
jgi:cysteine synthase A